MADLHLRGKRLIVVLGMHRSGTSAITRALQVLGVDLGDSLMPADESQNPTGFYEDLDVNSLNVEILRAVHHEWDFLRPVTSKDLDQLNLMDFASRAENILLDKFESHEIFGFKDPRSTKILPFWQGVFAQLDLDVSYVISLRNPRSVCESLAVRNQFEREKSYSLWLSHVVDSLAFTDGRPRTLVEFDDLMVDPETELRRVARDLKLDFDIEEFEAYKTSFLDGSLRHTIFQPTDLLNDESCPPLAYHIYHRLHACREEQGISSASLSDATFAWKQQLDTMEAAFRLADMVEADNANLKAVLLGLDKQIGQLVSDRDSIVNELEGRLKKQEAHITELNDLLSKRHSQIADLGSYVSDLEHRLDSIINSRSWKVTAPLRKVKKSLMNSSRTSPNPDF